jgi:hypothetical protein
MSVEMSGLNELIGMLNELGKTVPQNVATKAARQGAQVVLNAVKQDAPVFDGWLKASLTLAGERAKVRGKKVYEVTFDRAYNEKLVKISKDGKRSYYPASQEFGWKYPNGGYHVGLQFLKNNARDKAEAAEQKMIDIGINEINKVIQKYTRDMEIANGRNRGAFSRASSGYLNLRTGR